MMLEYIFILEVFISAVVVMVIFISCIAAFFFSNAKDYEDAGVKVTYDHVCDECGGNGVGGLHEDDCSMNDIENKI